MRNFIFFLAIIALGLYLYTSRVYWFLRPMASTMHIDKIGYKELPTKSFTSGLELLKSRNDNEAWDNFEKALKGNEDNLDAIWGKAEVLRRRRKYQESQALLDKVLSRNPRHAPTLITLSYIRYKEDKLDEAELLIGTALNSDIDKSNEALVYMMVGMINARRAQEGNLIANIRYGLQIKCYLDRAKALAPDLPEVRLALGTFYLKAPAIIGGSPDKALIELSEAVNLAPNFATANARLAQYYKKKDNMERYNLYFEIAQRLDPENEVLQEMNAQ
jgi:Tfp pilus assembly protein PilF